MNSFNDFGDDWDGQKWDTLMDLGLDPKDPDYSDLAPHGMSGDEGDDEEVDEDGMIEDYRNQADRTDEQDADGE